MLKILLSLRLTPFIESVLALERRFFSCQKCIYIFFQNSICSGSHTHRRLLSVGFCFHIIAHRSGVTASITFYRTCAKKLRHSCESLLQNWCKKALNFIQLTKCCISKVLNIYHHTNDHRLYHCTFELNTNSQCYRCAFSPRPLS
jgi:hypothetical protein